MREPGYYWVKRPTAPHGWRIAEVDGDDVFMMGTSCTFTLAESSGWEWGAIVDEQASMSPEPKESPCRKATSLELQLAALDFSFNGVLKQRNEMARAIESMQTRAHTIKGSTNLEEIHMQARGIIHRWTEDPPRKYEQEAP